MKKLKIVIYRDGGAEPAKTYSVPVAVVKVAAKVIPKELLGPLGETGIDVGDILKAALQEGIEGTIAEVEDHTRNEKIIVSIE